MCVTRVGATQCDCECEYAKKTPVPCGHVGHVCSMETEFPRLVVAHFGATCVCVCVSLSQCMCLFLYVDVSVREWLPCKG